VYMVLGKLGHGIRFLIASVSYHRAVRPDMPIAGNGVLQGTNGMRNKKARRTGLCLQ
jgi:hypothetical protein